MDLFKGLFMITFCLIMAKLVNGRDPYRRFDKELSKRSWLEVDLDNHATIH